MNFTARVLVYDSDPDQRVRIVGKLGDRGYHNLIARTIAEAVEIARNNQLDIIIVNAAVPEGERTELRVALQALWETRHLPVIVIGADDASQPVDERDAAIAEFLPREFHDLELFSHLSSLVRLKTMQAELARRLATTAEFGLATPRIVQPPKSVRGATILAVGCKGDLRTLVDNALGGGFAVEHVGDPRRAQDRVLASDAELVLVHAAGDGDAALALCAAMRAKARLVNIPLILFAEARAFSDPVTPYLSGANDVVPPTLKVTDLRTRATALIKQKRYRESMRSLYSSLGNDITSDRLTGLHTWGFLHAHLTRQIEDANSWNKSLAVGYVDILEFDAVNEDYGPVAADQVLHELGAIMANLVRGEDLVARVGGEEFCIVEPDTAPQVADYALQRIAGAIRETPLTVAAASEPIAIQLTIGHACLEPGDHPEDVIARARMACLGNRKGSLKRPARVAHLSPHGNPAADERAS